MKRIKQISYICINRKALNHNLDFISSQVKRRAKILLVVKAEAYGHGMVEVASCVERRSDIAYLGVSNLEEALRLREAGIRKSILVMGSVPPEDIMLAIENRITFTISSYTMAEKINQVAKKKKKKAKIHVELDTGMGRLGVWYLEALKLLFRVNALSNVNLEGAYTHFPIADQAKSKFSKKQIKIFQMATNLFKELYPRKLKYIHMANSAAIINYDSSHFNLVRPGIMAYGVSPILPKKINHLKPVLSFKTYVAFIKEVKAGATVSYGCTYKVKKSTKIGVLPIGYSSGYPFKLSNAFFVLIQGKKYPIIGRVTMDHIMVDLGLNSKIKEWDDVVLIGKSKNKSITVEEISERLRTIPYDVLCGLNAKLQRKYI